MYKSMSMARQSTVNQDRRRQKLRESGRRCQLRNANNLNYFRQIQNQSNELSKYGPVQFYFPVNRQTFEKIANVEELHNMLEYQKAAENLVMTFKINVSRASSCKKTKDGKPLYKIMNVSVFCRPCGPKIMMKFFKGATSNYQFKLVYFDNGHHHERNKNNPLIPTLEGNRRYKEIEMNKREIYCNLDWKNLFNEIFEKTKTDPLFYIRHPLYKYLPRFRRIYTNYKFQIMEMRYLNWQYWFQPHFEHFNPYINLEPELNAPEDNPDFFMMMHPEMRRNFLRYGDVCYLTIIDDGIIRKKASYYAGIKFWQIIAFSGLTQQNRFAPFCLAFLELGHHQPNSITKIAHYLFNIMKKTPKVIITPNDSFLDEVIQDMNAEKVFRGDHFLDPICELEKIAQTIKSPQQFKYFHELIQSTNPTDFYHHLDQLYRNVSPTLSIRKLLSQFLSKAKRMCFGLIESQTFMGLTFQYSGNKYMNNYYKWNFIEKWQIDVQVMNDSSQQYTNKYDLKEFIYMMVHQISRMLERGINYLQNRAKYEITKYEEVLDLWQFKKARYMVKYDVLALVLQEYGKSLPLQMRARPPSDPECPQIVTHDIYDRPLKAFFIVSPQPQYDGVGAFKRMRWRCGCLYSYKTGLPCSHELKVVLSVGSSLCDQIDDYWLCQNTRRRPVYNTYRKTHRNMMK